MYRLPIEFLQDKSSVSQDIVQDAQLLSGSKPLYELVLGVDSPMSSMEREFLPKYARFYTNNIPFLKDTQVLLKNGVGYKNVEIDTISEIKDVMKTEDSFIQDYGYVGWQPLRFINNNSKALHALYVYSIGSPLLSLVIPILSLFIPFLCMWSCKQQITMETYISWLSYILRNHSIADVFKFPSLRPERKMFLTGLIVFYIFQTYMNVESCKQAVTNISLVTRKLQKMTDVLRVVCDNMDSLISATRELNSYQEYNTSLTINRDVLRNLEERLASLGSYEGIIRKTIKIGDIMSVWHDIHIDLDLSNSLQFGLDCNIHIKHIDHLHSLVKAQALSACKFCTKNTKLKDVHYLQIAGDRCVSNSISLSRNILITGPNAAGKTTLIKSALTSVLMSQQFGVGPYAKGSSLNPYTEIHCYLNIPDTCDRDSLFQAEASRCKSIIDTVSSEHDKRHFCVFDELFSGTNPVEAENAGAAFIKHLSKKKNVNFMLTTHLADMCDIVGGSKRVRNMFMETKKDGEMHRPLFTLAKGISRTKGALNVLKDMNFPVELVSDAVKLHRG